MKTKSRADSIEAGADRDRRVIDRRESQPPQIPPSTEASNAQRENSSDPETVDPWKKSGKREMLGISLRRDETGSCDSREVSGQRRCDIRSGSRERSGRGIRA